MKVRPKRLNEVLVLDIDHVDVFVTEKYCIAGVFGFGRGLFARATIEGGETSYRKLHRLHAGQLIVSRLKAFEGALAIVPGAFEGWFVSPEFPTFRCVEGELEPGYLAHLCRWPVLWSLLRARSQGIGARRERVQAETLLGLALRIPPIDEQRRQVELMETAHRWAETAAARLGRQDSDSLVALLPGLVDAVVGQGSAIPKRIDTLADFVSDTVHPDDDPAPANCFVGLQHVERHTGRCLGSDPLGEMKGRKFRFRPGDVVYGYLRPYLNKVWLADRHGLCSVDQYVLRPRPGVSADLLAHVLRGRAVLDTAIGLTHSLQLPRLRSGLLAAIEIPTVAEDAALHLVRQLYLVQDRVIAVAAKRRDQANLVAALETSALNQAFAGLS